MLVGTVLPGLLFLAFGNVIFALGLFLWLDAFFLTYQVAITKYCFAFDAMGFVVLEPWVENDEVFDPD